MSSARQILRIVVILGAGCPGAGARDAAGPSPAAIEAKVDGATLRYAPQDVPKVKRTARGEMDMIQGIVASLEVERPISFRKVTLPRGSYALHVEVEDGKTSFLVIESSSGGGARAGSESAQKARRKKGAPGTEKSARALGEKTEESSGEKAVEKTREEARRKGRAGAAEDGPGMGSSDLDATGLPGGEAAGREGAPPSAEAGSSESRDGDVSNKGGAGKGPPPAARIRAPLAFSPCEKTGNSVTLELKLAGKGSKLRFTARAGGTEARTTLRFGEAK